MEIKRLIGELSPELCDQLSALDKLCVGAEGWSAESFRSEAAKENGFVLCVMDGDRVTALLTGYSAVGEADVTSVAVDPEYRRRGLARLLLEKFSGLLPADTESIFLEVRQSNAAAISLYEKFGFERLSIRKNFYSDPAENAVVMQKKLKG